MGASNSCSRETSGCDSCRLGGKPDLQPRRQHGRYSKLCKQVVDCRWTAGHGDRDMKDTMGQGGKCCSGAGKHCVLQCHDGL